MGWTFKTVDNQPVIITADKDEANRRDNCFYDEDICYDNCGENRWHPETGDTLIRISVQEFNEISGIGKPHVHFAGPGWTGKEISSEERHKKNLAKNPGYTTMSDYKMSNPNSIPSKSLERNKKRLEKKGIKVKQNG